MKEVVGNDREYVRFPQSGSEFRIDRENVRQSVMRILKKEGESALLVGMTKRISMDPDLQFYLFKFIHSDPNVVASSLELQKAIQFFETHPTWWEQTVEAAFERLAEEERRQTPESERGALDVERGIEKGIYLFGKGIIVGAWELIKLLVRLSWDPELKLEVLKTVGNLAIDCFILQFGTYEMKKKVLNHYADLAKKIYHSIVNKLAADWEAAVKDGTEKRLIAQWCTQGVLEIATFVIGFIKGVKAARAVIVTAREIEGAEIAKQVSNAEKALTLLPEEVVVADKAPKPNAQVVAEAVAQYRKDSEPLRKLNEITIKAAEDLRANKAVDPALVKRLEENAILTADEARLAKDMDSVGITREQIAAMLDKRRPLIFPSDADYAEFVADVQNALIKEGIKGNDGAVVIRGTSTTFYSENPKKPLGHHYDKIKEAPADLDLALEAPELKKLYESRVAAQAFAGEKGFLGNEKMREAFKHLKAVADKWADKLKRDVNIIGVSDPARTYPSPTNYRIGVK